MAFSLSKSKYCQAVQCPKMLWLNKYKPDLFDPSVLNQGVLNTGSAVGDLAMGLFGDFTEVPFGDLSNMLHMTQKLLDQGTPILAEASFAWEGLFCSVDILKNAGNKNVELYEVKSATEVHDIYYEDVAYQCYVLKKLGYTIKKACLIHINKDYCRQGELDIKQFFTIEDLSDLVAVRLAEAEENIAFLRTYMEQAEEPSCDIGEHCLRPYDCGFFGYCTRRLPTPNVFDVAGLRTAKKFEYYQKGIVSFSDLLKAGTLAPRYQQQVEFEALQRPPYIEKEPIREFLSTLSYPLYFLDFETFQPAVPLYDQTRPYQQIPFQYSLHYIEKEGGPLLHTEHLAYPGQDPRRVLAEQMCRDIPKNACTTAYNMSFEKGRIRELAALFPDLAPHLLNIHDHMVDLMVPFQKKWYYTKEMQGSYSIKYVLPALFPHDPALDYHNLEGVHNGSEASDAFSRMADMTQEEIETTQQQLLQYCGLDTFAMVKVWEKLLEITK